MEGTNTSVGTDSDLISSLPDEILHHILGFLHTKQAVQTCVLSKRWERLWTSLTSLNFDSSHFCPSNPTGSDAEKKKLAKKGAADFVQFVNWVLQRRKPLDLDVFHLEGSTYRAQYATDWIRYAVQHKTQSLQLRSCGGITCCIFTCMSLKELNLHNCSVYIYRKVNLPNLSKLSVSDMDLHSNNLNNIVYGCPILEYLLLRKCVVDEPVIAHAYLKHLSILNCRMRNNQVFIDTSNLLSLDYEDALPLNSGKVLNMPSLSLASLVSYYHTSCKQLETLFTAVGNVNHLNLQLKCNWSRGHQVAVSWELPTFQKLESLSVTCCLGSCVQVVNWILKSSPNMKKLTLLQPEGVKSGAGSKSKIAISACKNLEIVEVKYCRSDLMVEQLVDALLDEAQESENLKILLSKY